MSSGVDIDDIEKAWHLHRADDKRVSRAVKHFADEIFSRPKLHRLLDSLLYIAFRKGYEAAIATVNERERVKAPSRPDPDLNQKANMPTAPERKSN